MLAIMPTDGVVVKSSGEWVHRKSKRVASASMPLSGFADFRSRFLTALSSGMGREGKYAVGIGDASA
jgi:hypothetical protein